MKRILTLLIAVVLFTACNNKQTKPVETLITTESAKFTLTVINNTDQDMEWAQTWAMTGPDSGVVKAGDTVELASNETGGDVITLKPLPPTSVDQPNPTDGIFQMTYGWDGHIARVYADNVKNAGNPTKDFCYGCNWIYVTEWKLPSGVQTNATKTVTITTEAK